MNERTDKRVAQYLRTPFMAILNHSSRVSGADTFTVSTPFHSRCFHHPSSASIHFLYLTSYHLPFTFMSIFLAFSRSANRFNFLLLQLLSPYFFVYITYICGFHSSLTAYICQFSLPSDLSYFYLPLANTHHHCHLSLMLPPTSTYFHPSLGSPLFPTIAIFSPCYLLPVTYYQLPAPCPSLHFHLSRSLVPSSALNLLI